MMFKSINKRYPKFLVEAAKMAVPVIDDDSRAYWLGAVGVRTDGAVVMSRNGTVFSTVRSNYRIIPGNHAECRVLRKMSCYGVLYVSRVSHTYTLAMSRPCEVCQVKIRSKKISKVYYSINNFQYGVWDPHDDVDFVVDVT